MRGSAKRADFYSLPTVYDILHAPGTEGEVRGLLRIWRRWGAKGAQAPVWLEPACGTGRLLRALAGHGVRGVGFDRERGMVEEAGRLAAAGAGGVPSHDEWVDERGVRRGGTAVKPSHRRGVRATERARFFLADMERFAHRLVPGSVHFAFNLINTIRHLPSDAAMLRHFGEMRRVLAPGGVYAVGISLAAYGLETETEDVWRGCRGGMSVTQVVQYIPAASRRTRGERVVSHMTIRAGGEESHVDSVYSLRSYDLAQWRRLVGRAGAEVVGIVDQDGRATGAVEPGYAVWVLGFGKG